MALGDWPGLGLNGKVFELQRLKTFSFQVISSLNISLMRTCQQQLGCR